MNIISKTLAAPALAIGLATLAGPALAEQPGKDWMPMDQVVRTLEQAGYANVTKLEADDGHWEGKALKDGRTVKFHADPRTGTVTKETIKDAKAGDANKAGDEDDD